MEPCVLWGFCDLAVLEAALYNSQDTRCGCVAEADTLWRLYRSATHPPIISAANSTLDRTADTSKLHVHIVKKGKTHMLSSAGQNVEIWPQRSNMTRLRGRIYHDHGGGLNKRKTLSCSFGWVKALHDSPRMALNGPAFTDLGNYS